MRTEKRIDQSRFPFCLEGEKVTPMWKVGLTGGIACGKSTVTAYLKEQGIQVIDADEISHQLMGEDPEIKAALLSHFGEDILDQQGDLDRKEIAKRVYASADELSFLNRLMHPRIRQSIEEDLAQLQALGNTLAVIDVPLLYEAHFEDLVDEILVVALPKAMEVERLMERDGIGQDLAEKKIASQLALEEKIARADRVIDNSGTIASTKNQVEAWLKEKEEKHVMS